jgi:hypothetical protein
LNCITKTIDSEGDNIMERPATWKVVTVGAALTGLGILGAGTATAAVTPTPAAVFDVSVEAPFGDFIALGDDWTDTHWTDDWTDTYWDD